MVVSPRLYKKRTHSFISFHLSIRLLQNLSTGTINHDNPTVYIKSKKNHYINNTCSTAYVTEDTPSAKKLRFLLRNGSVLEFSLGFERWQSMIRTIQWLNRWRRRYRRRPTATIRHRFLIPITTNRNLVPIPSNLRFIAFLAVKSLYTRFSVAANVCFLVS